MTRVTVDQSTRDRLAHCDGPVELCDDEGTVLGRFIPLLQSQPHDYYEPEISEEELQRRENSTEWYTLDEILRELESK